MGYKHNIEDVIQRGIELVRTQGYHNVGINQILKASGIPKGSFYNFFPSKEAFIKAALESYGRDYSAWIRGLLQTEDPSPLSRLRSFYRILIDANEADEYAGGCLINTVSNEVGRNNDIIGEAADNGFQKLIQAVAECVELGQQAGEITTNYTALELAEYLHAGIYGSFSRMKVTRSRAYMDRWYQMTFDFITN
ncbi:MAG: TetR/AcrR family transcriptional regulator [Bacteroidota bacterium]